MKRSVKWQRAELLLFTLFTLLNLLPFVATKFFPSMDGASHLANSNIINQITVHGNEFFRQFFILNPEPVPNWISHFLVSLMTLVMPAFLAEKILIMLILAGTPFAFRALVNAISPEKTLLSFLVFPFTHSMFFFFGFFNFCMGIMVLLFTLSYWVRLENKPITFRHTALLALLIALNYFSHIVIFGTLLIAIATHILVQAAVKLACHRVSFAQQVRETLRRILAVTAASILPLGLFIYFFVSRPGTREVKFLPREELTGILTSLRPLVSMNPALEGKYLQVLFYTLVFLLAAGAAFFILRVLRKVIAKHNEDPTPAPPLLPGFHFWWLLAFLGVMKILFFLLPNDYGTASYTSLRLGLFLLLFTVVWASTFRMPAYVSLIAVMAALTVNTLMVRYHTPGMRDLGKLASQCNKAAEFVKPNSLVLPIYCMDNWFTGHFVDYIAVDKPVVMVYNYECESGYFPVRWNEPERKNYYLGNPSAPDKYIRFEIVKGKPSLPLDYVFIVGHYDPDKDWFFTTLHKALAEEYVRVYEAENCSLYQNKRSNQ